MASQEQAKEVRNKLQLLNQCDIFSLGVKPREVDVEVFDYALLIVLRAPFPYGLPHEVEGVEIVYDVLPQTEPEETGPFNNGGRDDG